jgi:hypothetical protein
MTNVPVDGAPSAIAAICRPIIQGWTPPSIRHRHRPGESFILHWHLLGLAPLSWHRLSIVHWCRAPSPSHAVTIELQGQLLAREKELDSREGVVVTWEEGLVVFMRALWELHAGHDTSRVHADAIQWDFFAQVCTSISRSKQLTNLGWALEERQILLSMHEADLEVHETMLEEELERGMHSSDGWNLSAELDKARMREWDQ